MPCSISALVWSAVTTRGLGAADVRRMGGWIADVLSKPGDAALALKVKREVGEMARASGGAEVHLDKAPLKYAGLAPWEIFLSEAQERMTSNQSFGKIVLSM